MPAALAAADHPPTRLVAALVTEYRHNSHADVIVSRLRLTDTLDGTGRDSPLKLASLYTDQKPADDISRLLAAPHRFPIKPSIADALTLGTGKLAVDGVLLVAEHGDYGKPALPVERTLLTIGTLDALLQSHTRGGARLDTPHLRVSYQPTWRWREPPPPPRAALA